MNVNGTPYRAIAAVDDGRAVEIVDQTRLPHVFALKRLTTLEEAAAAIRDMEVRGAPLIGATAAWGMCFAARHDASDSGLARAAEILLATRPTAVNLRHAIDDILDHVRALPEADRPAAAVRRAAAIGEEDIAINHGIGDHGLPVLRALADAVGNRTLHVLTHCNAGWLATVDWGTATAPIYRAHRAGIPIHVWVSETRPRNQGASLTAWELGQEGVPHTVVADNAAGHLMQRGEVDVCITGTDRTTARGDVCNKIGTYLKALAAREHGVPFYATVPGPSIDWTLTDGRDIPIEDRGAREVTHISGITEDGRIETVRLTPEHSPAANAAFDVTPAGLVTGIITERGVCRATADGLAKLYGRPAAIA